MRARRPTTRRDGLDRRATTPASPASASCPPAHASRRASAGAERAAGRAVGRRAAPRAAAARRASWSTRSPSTGCATSCGPASPGWAQVKFHVREQRGRDAREAAVRVLLPAAPEPRARPAHRGAHAADRDRARRALRGRALSGSGCSVVVDAPAAQTGVEVRVGPVPRAARIHATRRAASRSSRRAHGAWRRPRRAASSRCWCRRRTPRPRSTCSSRARDRPPVVPGRDRHRETVRRVVVGLEDDHAPEDRIDRAHGRRPGIGAQPVDGQEPALEGADHGPASSHRRPD